MHGDVERGQRGQTTSEYIGLIVVIAAVLGAIGASDIGGVVTTAVKDAICTVAGGDCASGTSRAGADDASPASGDGAPPPGVGDAAVDPGGGGAGAGTAAGTGASTGAQNAAAPPPVDAAVVDAAVDDIEDALDGNWNGVGNDELGDIADTLAGLSPAEFDAVIGQMSDDQLEELFDQLDDSGFLGSGWDWEERRDFLNLLMERASPETLARLRRFTDELQPGFDGVGGDSAGDEGAPANTAEYGEIPHQVFLEGEDDGASVHPNDVEQGLIADCWVIAGMASIAQQNPELIEQMVRENENGTYTVTLYDEGEPVEVTVTPDVPLVDGEPVFARFPTSGVDQADGDYELWPMLLEKAYAQYEREYGEIEYGYTADALETFTGHESESHDMDEFTIEELETFHDDGGAIALSSLDEEDATVRYENDDLANNHAYYVEDVDAANDQIVVRNPWGYDEGTVTVTYEEFQDNFGGIDTNTLGG